MGLPDKYRPRDLGEVLAQPGVVETIRSLAEGGNLAGEAYWISGQSGTGKTTLALIMAGMVADKWHTQEIVARKLTRSDIEEWEYDSWHAPLSGKGRAYIINEAHGLSAPAIETLLQTLENEQWQKYNTVIFTTTVKGQLKFLDAKMDSRSLLSRCIPLPLAQRNLAKTFAARVKEIAGIEGLDGRPEKDYVRLAEDCGNNMRAMLQKVAAGKMKVTA